MSVQNPGFGALHAASLPNALNATLQAATRRIRFLLALRYMSRGLCWSSVACLLIVAMSKLHLVFETPKPAVIGGVIGASVLLGFGAAFVRRLTPLAVAKSTDRRTDLKDRLSSALEFQSAGIDPSAPFYSEQLADAARAVQGVDIKAAYPSRTPKELIVGAALSLALFGLFFLPSLPLFWSKDHKDEVAEVKKKGIEIIKLAEDKQKTADQQKLTETKKAAAEAKKLGEAMEKGKMTKKESLVALQHLLKKMEETQKQSNDKQAEKMKAAAANMKRSLDKMQKEMEQKQKEKEAEAKAQNKPTDPRNIQKPNQNAKADQPKQSPAMQKAQEAMKQMADALANQDNQQMKSAMEKMADQMKSGQMSKEEQQQMQKALQQMAQALKEGGQQQAGEKMQQMAAQMQQMSSMSAENMAKMAAQMQQMGQMMGKGEGGTAMMDMKELDKLAQSMKNGSMMGKGPGGFGGNGPGKGYGGQGHATSPMKDPNVTHPRLVAMGKQQLNKGVGKNGDAQELAKYMSEKSSSAKHLPNGKIAGSRTAQGQELQMNMTGDPDPAHSSTPYYQVYQASKKQAESTLDKESIPATYKEQVKKYFENIRP